MNANDVFEIIENERNGLAKIHTVFKDFPAGIFAHYQFYKQIILSEDLPLSRTEREFLAVKTSEANQCPYCIGHHKSALENAEAESLDKSRAKLLEELAQTLTKEMWRASPLKSQFLKVGFSEAEWQHAVMVVSYFNFANRCAHAMQLELEENYEETCK